MSRDEERRRLQWRSSSRPLPLPRIADGGPLRELKQLFHRLYVEAGTPVLDDIVGTISAQYAAGKAPTVLSRDVVAECISSPSMPKQNDALAVAGALASHTP